MSLRRDAAALRWLVGAELAACRRQAAIRPADVCAAAEISKAKLSHMENGRYQQHPADITRLLRYYGTPEPDIARLTALAGVPDVAATPPWWQPWASVLPRWFTIFLGLEGMAAAEFGFEPLVVPGLLQTRAYAAELLRATGLIRPDHRDRFVACRVARADRLTGAPALRCHAIIGESALHLRVGDESVRQAQLRRLLALADTENVTVQVLRPESGPHPALNGAFTLLDFPTAGPVAYLESLDGARYVADPDELRTYQLARATLTELALAPDDSVALLGSLVG